jgi:DNA primase
MLSCYRLDPGYARLPEGTDPADLLALRGPTALTEALAAAQPLAERLLDERLANLPPAPALLEAARVVAARPARYWEHGSSAISLRLGMPMPPVRHTLLTLCQRLEHRLPPSRSTILAVHQRNQAPNTKGRREPNRAAESSARSRGEGNTSFGSGRSDPNPGKMINSRSKGTATYGSSIDTDQARPP